MTLDSLDNAEDVRSQVPEATLSRVSRWMNGNHQGEDMGSASNLATAAGKGRSSATGNLIRKLENDKESLSLQVKNRGGENDSKMSIRTN